MYRSKARLTQAEIDEALERHGNARSTPVMLVGEVDMASSAMRSFGDYMDRLATSYGLAPQGGEWGLDAATGQFLSNYPIVEPTADDIARKRREAWTREYNPFDEFIVANRSPLEGLE